MELKFSYPDEGAHPYRSPVIVYVVYRATPHNSIFDKHVVGDTGTFGLRRDDGEDLDTDIMHDSAFEQSLRASIDALIEAEQHEQAD